MFNTSGNSIRMIPRYILTMQHPSLTTSVAYWCLPALHWARSVLDQLMPNHHPLVVFYYFIIHRQ